MPRPIHIIEPTLEDYAGHCYSLVHSLCQAARNLAPVHVWAGKGAANLDLPSDCAVHAHFKRRLRLPQAFLLLRRLFRDEDSRIVVLTAKRADLILVRLAAGATLPEGKLSLYFHWFRETPARNAFLRKVAVAQPNVAILATTESVATGFKSAGFRRVILLPYPLTGTASHPEAADIDFRHLLYAGAARQDKGFKHVVDLVQLLHDRRMNIPVTVQVSAEHYGKYDALTRDQLRRLEGIGYSSLSLVREPLSPDDYGKLFQGAICLQPYDPTEFRDRVSGVTMDALIHGAPIIATAGSWIARQIAPYDAGQILDNPEAQNLFLAVESVSKSYGKHRNGAHAAATHLRGRSWEPLISLLQ